MGWVSSDVRRYDRITLFCFSSGFWPGSVSEYKICEKLILFNRQQRYMRREIQCCKNKVRNNSLYFVCSVNFIILHWTLKWFFFPNVPDLGYFHIITSIQYKYFSTVVFLQLIFQMGILSWPFVGSSLCENVLFWDEFSLCCVIPEVIFHYGKHE